MMHWVENYCDFLVSSHSILRIFLSWIAKEFYKDSELETWEHFILNSDQHIRHRRMYFVLKIGKIETCATISSHIIKKNLFITFTHIQIEWNY